MIITITVEDEDSDGGTTISKRSTESWEIAEQNFYSLKNHFNV